MIQRYKTIESLNAALPINSLLAALYFCDPILTKSGKRKRYVACLCQCGNTKNVFIGKMIEGTTLSCGCIMRINRSKSATTHGLTNTPLFRVWRGMKSRCTNSNHLHYKHYGGRGITICAEWLNDFKAFYDWSISNGWKEGLEIDRINNNGIYEPLNCRYVTSKVNSRNKRNCKYIEYNGETKSMSEWSEVLKIPIGTIIYRLETGRPIKEVFSKSKNTKKLKS